MRRLEAFVTTLMPTPFGDSFLTDIVQPGLQDRSDTLPIHTSTSGIELNSFDQLPQQSKHPAQASHSRQSSRQQEEYSDSSGGQISKKKKPSPIQTQRYNLGEGQTVHPSSPYSDIESDGSQMSRKPRSSHRNQGDERPSSTASGQNGHANANGNMDNHLEMRRKHLSIDSPTSATQTASLIGRDSFSLDNEPPQTPIPNPNSGFFDLPRQDRRNFCLLVLLYFLQGIPMGLASGSVPFLLKKRLSYGQIGVFSLAAYPYSLKLLWSPIVDAVWSPKLGRRKSWILPIQMCSGVGMLYLGSRVEAMMVTAGAQDGSGVWNFTYWWFMLVFLCATQDIAVDGWALTLLSPPNLSYASTAQTVGLTGGHFLSYTVFLAFQAPDFANRWFRKTPLPEGIMTLGGYLSFWGWAYIMVTLGLALLKKEDKTKDRDGILEVYKSMLGVLKLRNIQSIIVIHLIAKIGFQANDAVTNLKLLDKGFSDEDLALTVLIDFPFEIGLGYYAGRWSTSNPPIHVWCWAFVGRLAAAVLAQLVVMIFPSNGVQPWYLLTVIASHIFSTFSSTVMFVAISAFHAKIADPVIGGTYMTLLATYAFPSTSLSAGILTIFPASQTLAAPSLASSSLSSSTFSQSRPAILLTPSTKDSSLKAPSSRSPSPALQKLKSSVALVVEDPVISRVTDIISRTLCVLSLGS